MRAADLAAKRYARSRKRQPRPRGSWSQSEIDGKLRRVGGELDNATLDALVWCAMFDALGNTWRRGDWRPGHYALTASGFARLGFALWNAELTRAAARGGFGQRPTGSVDATWLLFARCWLADHEIGWIFRAADVPNADVDEALARWEPKTADEADQRAREARKRWDRLRAAGFQDVRLKTAK